MKLVKVRHIRCNEDDFIFSIILAPDSWSEEVINDRIKLAKQDYLAGFKAANEDTLESLDWPGVSVELSLLRKQISHWNPNYALYPKTMTIEEIDEDWKAKQRVYNAWKEKQASLNQSFEDFLLKWGFTPLWEYDDIEIFVDWGHMHGTPLKYGTDVSEAMLVMRDTRYG